LGLTGGNLILEVLLFAGISLKLLHNSIEIKGCQEIENG
jgi:hypothetical protein